MRMVALSHDARRRTVMASLAGRWCRRLSGICLVLALGTIASPAQDAPTFTTLYNFCSQTNCADGEEPTDYGSLVQGLDGNFYGTTEYGGANNYGTVFKISTGGALTTLYSFCAETNCTDGSNPAAGLVLGTDGSFYGTTAFGGVCNGGTVFRITSGGRLTSLHSFNCQTDGYEPVAGLVQATDGNFYGTTWAGGAGSFGTVFKITAGGTLTTLYNFCSQTNCTDGGLPVAGVIQANDGNFYGTTYLGGTSTFCNSGCGTVFKVTKAGALSTLYSFCSQANCTDGLTPTAGLVQATNGNFYGTTDNGGISTNCPYNEPCGTVFKVTAAGKLTTLYSFCPSQTDCTDGNYPYAGLVQATDGNFYGTTLTGGAYPCEGLSADCGTVFKITAAGTVSTVHSFDGTDGLDPTAGLVQGTNGEFYGTTTGGGANAYGTVFSLAVGLGPFVKTVPTSGKVGTPVTILGNNLTGSTSVTFNGTKAQSFTVNSTGTAITTTVPTGATTGFVKVTTPSGKILTSNVKFRVP